MDKIEQLKAIAAEALDKAERTKLRSERLELLEIAQEAIQKAEALKASQNPPAPVSAPTNATPQVQPTAAPAPSQAVTAPSMPNPELEVLNKVAPRMNRQAPQTGGAMPSGGVAPRMDQGQGAMGGAKLLEGGQAIVETAKENPVLAGTLAGATAGAPLGVPGVIIGGAVGAAGGSMAGDKIKGAPISYYNAAKEAAISLGLDLGTLGLARFAKMVHAMYKAGRNPKEAVAEIAEMAYNPQARSVESLAQSQQTLQKYNTTMSPAELGQGGLAPLLDSLTSQALGGAGAHKARREAIENAVQAEYRALFNEGGGSVLTPNEVAGQVVEIVTAGKAALNESYSQSLKGIQDTLGNKMVNVAPIKRRLKSILDDNKVSDGLSKLDDDTVKLLEEWIETLPNSMKGADLLEIEKKFMREISKRGDFNNSAYNNVSSLELAQASETFRKATLGSIAQVSPEAAKAYSLAKGDYAKGLGQILPELNANLIKKGGKGQLQALGNLFTNVNNLDQVKTAYSQIRAAYGTMTPEQIAKAGLPTDVDAALDVIRQNYIRNLIVEPNSEQAIMSAARLAKRFDIPKEYAKLEAIMGVDKAQATKRYLNMLADVMTKPDTAAGTLVLRSKEAGATGQVLQGVVGGAVSVGSLIGAAGVFIAPAMIQKIITRPALANKIIAATKNPKLNTPDKLLVYINDLIANSDIYDDGESSWNRQPAGMAFNEAERRAIQAVEPEETAQPVQSTVREGMLSGERRRAARVR